MQGQWKVDFGWCFKNLRKYFTEVTLSVILLTFKWLLLSWGVHKRVLLLFAVISYKELLCSLESGDSKSFSNAPRPLQRMIYSLLGRHVGWNSTRYLAKKAHCWHICFIHLFWREEQAEGVVGKTNYKKPPTPQIIILNYLCWCECRRRLADFLELQHQNDSDIWDEKCSLLHRDTLFLLLRCCVQQRCIQDLAYKAETESLFFLFCHCLIHRQVMKYFLQPGSHLKTELFFCTACHFRCLKISLSNVVLLNINHPI